MSRPVWQWDESIQRGWDYKSITEVRRYDERMSTFRDAKDEAREILSRLALSPDDVVLEFGTGTGLFAREAAGRCRKVIAIDVSPTMLDYAALQAQGEQIDNIVFVNAGFLTYQHHDAPVAAIVSQMALHHLPDAWKLIALERLSGFLREEGRFYLSDVVYADRVQTDWASVFRRAMDQIDVDGRDEMGTHIREEYSTFDWIIRQMLVRAGFEIEWAEIEGDLLGRYLCRKTRA